MDMIVCTYEDRLARFGITLLETICTFISPQIVVTPQKRHPLSLEEQVVQDGIVLITSLAGKLHRARRGQLTLKALRKSPKYWMNALPEPRNP